MVRNRYSNFLNLLTISSLKKSLYFDVHMTSKLRRLASLLLSLNVIRRFHRLNSSTYRVFPSYTRYRRYARKYKTYTRLKGRIQLQAKAIRLLNINTPHSYYVLDTSRGVVTHKEALKFGIGGVLLMIIL